MVGLITLSLVKYSDGNIVIYQLHFENNGNLDGYMKMKTVTMTAIIIVFKLGVCKLGMAHNGLVACAVAELKVGRLMEVPKVERPYLPEACTKPPLRNCHVLTPRS